MNGYLPKFELTFYLCFYIILLIIILFNVQTISNCKYRHFMLMLLMESIFFLANLPDYKDFGSGWSIINRKIDDYDTEWLSWKSFIINNWYWFIVHSVLAELFRLLKFKHISFLYFIVGSSACTFIYNFRFLIAMCLQAVTFFLVTRKSHAWCLMSLWLILLNWMKFGNITENVAKFLLLDTAQMNDFLIIFAWALLRGLSFSLERVNYLEDKSKFTLIDYLGYNFYFPTLVSGPTVIYSRYMEMLDVVNNQIAPIVSRIRSLIINLIRFAFWFLLTELALHYFYIHSIVLNLDLRLLNPLAFFGLGYLMGQFFNNKYIIHYGVPITFGQFDGIPMPKTPRCICRVHKYSEMWKWFDHGLYEFLFKYIYASICHRRSSLSLKMFAGFITFVFIYIWHGFFDYILIWSIMNCVCVVLEKIFYYHMDSERFHAKALSIVKTENNVHRLKAFFGSHILIPAIISNFFFFGGVDVGSEFIRRTYLDGLLNYAKISMCIYFLYPIAEAIQRWELMRSNKK